MRPDTMTEPERLLEKIAALASLQEIEGWRQGVAWAGRAWAPGEVAALAERERKLQRRGKGHA